ncbi:hypothetical protein P7K49_038364 [Saguinus oedipus]|uniref:Uncharacterized protein n=1 Tax=Saguinus oedipus TaxID=9490 RepID=A0ABQ9TEG4_SAGOE|nr:hypothetical protein P7K49_038364 [Saguinus oedipus]
MEIVCCTIREVSIPMQYAKNLLPLSSSLCCSPVSVLGCTVPGVTFRVHRHLSPNSFCSQQYLGMGLVFFLVDLTLFSIIAYAASTLLPSLPPLACAITTFETLPLN